MLEDGIGTQTSALASSSSYFVQGEPNEGFPMVNETLREALTLLVQIAKADEEDERQLLLGLLCVLQEKNNALVEQIGLKVMKFPEGGFGMIVGDLGKDDGITTDDITSGLSATYVILQITDLLSKQALSNWAATSLGPFLATYLPYIAAAALAASGIYYLSTHDPEWVTPWTEEDQKAFELRRDTGKFNEEDFKRSYPDSAWGRNQYLGYIEENDPELYQQEIAIAGAGYSFSEAEQIRIEKDLPEPQPTPLKPISEGVGKWLDSQNLVLYPDTGLVLDGAGKTISSPFANARVLNDGADDIGGIGTAPGISDPLTGAGAVVDFPLPYGCVFGTQNNLAERLTDVLERLVEVCALPRVSVGMLAETAIIREEADLDALARRFADELLRAQLIS